MREFVWARYRVADERELRLGCFKIAGDLWRLLQGKGQRGTIDIRVRATRPRRKGAESGGDYQR